MPTMLRTHRFTLILRDVADITDALENSMLGIGCDDALLWSREGITGMHFEREAESLGDAIGSAVNNVEQAGHKLARVEIEDLRWVPAL